MKLQILPVQYQKLGTTEFYKVNQRGSEAYNDAEDKALYGILSLHPFSS